MASQVCERGPLKNRTNRAASWLSTWAVPLALMAAISTHAEEKSPFSLDAKTDIYSAYVWRGKVLDRNAVWQPSAIATLDMQDAGAFSLKTWSNWNLSQNSSRSQTTKSFGGLNVLNFTPSYTKAFGPVGVTVGNIWYTFPGDCQPEKHSTEELFTTVAYKNSIVTPSFSVYYDYRGVGGSFLEDDPAKDLYARAALDKTIPLGKRFSAGGAVLLGGGTSHYNAVRYHSPDEGFADYQASSCVSYAVTDAVSIGVTVAYTGLVGGEWGIDRHAMSPASIFWGGVNLRWLF